jgi:hypothetical protein
VIRLALIALAALGAVWTAERVADSWETGRLDAPLSAAHELVQTVTAAPPFAREPSPPAGDSTDARAPRAPAVEPAPDRTRAASARKAERVGASESGGARHGVRTGAEFGPSLDGRALDEPAFGDPEVQAADAEHAMEALATPAVASGAELGETASVAAEAAPTPLPELQPLDARTAETIRYRLGRVMDLAGKARP